MAIKQRIVNDLYTECYVEEVNWITESFPTNFHTFTRQRIVVPGESVDKWREVTTTQKEVIEAADAKWVRPPQEFIDRWNLRCGIYGNYNEETGYFELNGLKDITYAQAIKIDYTSHTNIIKSLQGLYSAANTHCHCRTFYPIHFASYTDSGPYYFGDMSSIFMAQGELEVFQITGYFGVTVAYPTKIDWAFRGCANLRKIELNLSNCTSGSTYWTFHNCIKLEDVKLYKLKISLDFRYSPLITLESFQYIINNAINTDPITLTVHKNIYAKLTGDITNEAAANLSEEELEQWMSLVSLAEEKNITFNTI